MGTVYNHGLPMMRRKAEGGGGVDTSQDTVMAEVLVKDYTAHDKDGKPIVGVLDVNALCNEAYSEGHKTGYILGSIYSENKGKDQLHDEYWEAIQLGGARTNYQEAFKKWTNNLFKPKYSFNVTSAQRMFQNAEISNIKAVLEEKGLTFSTAGITALTQTFQSCSSEELPFIDASLATNTSYGFSSSSLKSIHLRVSETTKYSSTFAYASALTSINLEGTIGQNGFDVSWSPLDKASLTSIVNALSEDTTGLPVTLRLAAVNTAFETAPGAADGSTSDEWLALMATKSNWTISLINS